MNRYYCATSDFERAGIVIVGVGYDGTSSFRPGSRFGPQAIREASYSIESYSPYARKDLRSLRICDMGDIPLPYGDKDLILKIIASFTGKVISKGKKLVSLGGEHLISLPIIENYSRKYNDLVVIHVDAHSDLVDSYMSEKVSHATVMRRVAEVIGFENLFQFGIRSLTETDMLLPLRDSNMFMFSLGGISDCIDRIGNRHVYITFDLDVFDPSVLPGTGTPEPGGITYREFIEFVDWLSNLNVVGIDVVELSPHYDTSGISAVVAASVVREMLLL